MVKKTKGIKFESNVKTLHVLDKIIEIFGDFDLNDNNTILFNDCVNELINRVNNYEKDFKQLTTKNKKVTTLMNKYKKAYFDTLSKDDIQKLAEKAVER